MNFAIFTRSDDVRLDFFLKRLKKRNLVPKIIFIADKKNELPLIQTFKKLLKNESVNSNPITLDTTNLNFTFVDSHTSQSTLSILKSNDIDYVFLCKTGLIPKKMLEGNIKYINTHPSILPLYRGRGSLEWAIFNGGPLGYTVHFIDENVDTGPIIFSKEVIPQKGESFFDYKKRLNLESVDSVCDILMKIEKKENINLISQEKYKGIHFFRKPLPQEMNYINMMFINFNQKN